MFLVGGEATDLEECEPLLQAMGRKIVHVGKVGMGTSLKMVLNLLLAEAMVAFAEGMALGQSLGIEQEALFELLLGGPVVAPFVAGKREKIKVGVYDADFPLRLMQKDLHLAAKTAYEQEVPLPLGNVAKEVYALAVQAGLADRDFSAICKYLAAQ